MPGKIKILLAKAGLDPHDKGIKLLARTLKEVGGMEVIYTGLYRNVDEIASLAVQQQVDIVGLSVHTGMQMTLFKSVRELLNQNGGGKIILIGGGVMPDQDIRELKSTGCVEEIFGPYDPVTGVIDWIQQKCQGRRANVEGEK